MLALVLLCGIWAWWGWQKGAYFGTVMLPGLIVLCIGAALLIRFAPWRLRLRLSTPIVVALSALLGLALWELLSALWTLGARHRHQQRPAHLRVRDGLRPRRPAVQPAWPADEPLVRAARVRRSVRWADDRAAPRVQQRHARPARERRHAQLPPRLPERRSRVLRDRHVPRDLPRDRPHGRPASARRQRGGGDAVHRPHHPRAEPCLVPRARGCARGLRPRLAAARAGAQLAGTRPGGGASHGPRDVGSVHRVGRWRAGGRRRDAHRGPRDAADHRCRRRPRLAGGPQREGTTGTRQHERPAQPDRRQGDDRHRGRPLPRPPGRHRRRSDRVGR